MKQLSKIVLGNFKPMIPVKFHQMWQKGLDSGDYYLKLCGSGGGGYFLGFTEDYKKTQEILKNYKLELVYRF
jgi:mevalonate kinase